MEKPTAHEATKILERKISISWGWVAFFAVLLFEGVLFHEFAVREVVWAYPPYSDQTVILQQSYETYDAMLHEGVWAGIKRGLAIPSPQGRMLPLQAALLFVPLGASRMTALTLNFFYFALLQFALTYTWLSITKRWSIAFLGLALSIASGTQYFDAGGIMDFRLDFINFCLFGVFLCAVLRSDIFASRRWSVVAAAAGALLLWFRFLMAPSMAVILTGTFIFLLVRLKTKGRSNAAIHGLVKTQLQNLILTCGLIAAAVAPIIWIARSALQAYYVGEVVRGATDVRAQEAGIQNGLDWLIYYPRLLFLIHLGSIFLTIAFAACALIIIGAVFGRRLLRTEKAASSRFTIPFAFVAFALATTVGILTIYPTRNPVVANVLVCPVILLVMLGVAWFADRFGCTAAGRRMLMSLAVIALSISLAFAFSMTARPGILRPVRVDTEEVMRAMGDIIARSSQAGWTSPRIAVDRITDYYPGMEPLAYERYGFLMQPRFILGNDIFPPTEEHTIQAIREADFAIINNSAPPHSGFDYPFNNEMRRLQPKLRAAALESLDPIRHFTAFSSDSTVYMRPSVTITGASSEWITSEGIDLLGSFATLHRRPHVNLHGITILQEYLVPEVHVKAELRDAVTGELIQNIPAQITIPYTPKISVNYDINITLDPAKMPETGDARIHLSFDKYVIPKDVGYNPDIRQLVMMTPTAIHLLR